MKVAFIFDTQGRRPLLDENGNSQVFPVYKLVSFIRTAPGRWQLDLHAFINACTSDFKFQTYQGAIAIGRNNRGVWVELTIGLRTLHLGAQHT